MRFLFVLVCGLSACAVPTIHAAPERHDPALRLHGHNDYLQPVPFKKALELGLGSIEADIYLVDGELRVGHERWQLRAGKTLQSMYLEPLRVAAAKGPLRADGEPLVLLVDIKADGDKVYRHLRTVLRGYGEMLTRFVDGRIEPGAVTVLLSGSRPQAMLARETDRFCALDGRMRDLNVKAPPPLHLVPWVSGSWREISDWTGSDDLMAGELQRVKALLAKAHAQGRKVRFWAAPDRKEAWAAFFDLGIDLICTDQPRNAARWLRANRATASAGTPSS